MKITKSIAIIPFIYILLISCKDAKTSASSTIATTKTSTPKLKIEIAAANLQTANFTIEGMSCAIGCAKTIQEELTNLEGVQTATVDFDKKWATVTFDKTIQTPENLTKVVQAIGDGKTYTVSNMKL